MAATFPFPRIDPRTPGPVVDIERPVEVATFSYDDTHTYRADESSLKYYYPPQLPVDLTNGFSTFNRHEDVTDTHLDSLLATLLTKERKTGTKAPANFITWRGMMTKILTAPYDPYSEFTMKATLFQSTIFIEEDFYASQQNRAQQDTRRPPRTGISHQMMTYWGYKFETLCLIPKPRENMARGAIERRHTLPVSNAAQFCSIVRTGFGPGLSVVIGGEVDAIMSPKPPPEARTDDTLYPYVELKTAEDAPLNNDRAVRKWENKLLRFWAQSYLLGVPKIVVGLRDQRGMLRKLEQYNTLEIPGGVARNARTWDKGHCVVFAAEFLKFLKMHVTEERAVYAIRKVKGDRAIRVEKLAPDGGAGGNGEDMAGIVSEEFIKWREELDREVKATQAV